MYLISATSSQLLYAVVSSACVSERHTDETHRPPQPRNSDRLVDFSETLKALMSALVSITALGD
jgi:hypothetical protein